MRNRYHIELYESKKRNPIDRYEFNQLRYALFPKDDAVSWCIINGVQYEPYIFEFFDKNKISLEGYEIVDAGANNGSFTIDFALLVGNSGKVHSFEPQRIVYYQLCGNVFINGFDNVYCHNVALGEKTETCRIQRPNYFSKNLINLGDVKIHPSLNEEYDLVDSRPLDSYAFDRLRLIKIDTQGYEYYILNGAIQTIKKHRPYIIIEIEEKYLIGHGLKESDIYNFFKENDYSVFQFYKGIPFSTTTGFCIDYVAIPNEKSPEKYIIP